MRRGVTDLDGTGEVVSGIVVMRQGQNALEVIDRVKAKIKEIEPGLPAGVKIVPIYDRSDLIQRAIDNMKSTLVEVMITVSLVILIFLWHFPSAIIPMITIPVAVLISFIPFRLMGVTANIMSLGGIAIAMGALVDAAIVVVEQTHKKLEKWDRTRAPGRLPGGGRQGGQGGGGAEFFALLVIAVSFLPVLTPGGPGRPDVQAPGLHQEPLHGGGRGSGHHPGPGPAAAVHPHAELQFPAAAGSAGWPTPCWWAPSIPRRSTPSAGCLIRFYEPVVAWSLRRKWWVIGGGHRPGDAPDVRCILQLGSEFMPPLEEGSILYMPSTMPGISISEAQKLLQVTDRIIKGFPEVDRVLGKAGRAETSTDPAPLSMLETVITLKPKSQWRRWTPGTPPGRRNG